MDIASMITTAEGKTFQELTVAIAGIQYYWYSYNASSKNN